MDYVSAKFEVPSMEIGEGERQKLLNIETAMHQRIIGQSEAIKAISGALKRARAGVTDSKKPIGSFLFLGPTGVGKTETAKALAESYFGDENRIIRFDMSEYQNEVDIYRFIGSSETRDQGSLTTAVREHPFSLILFDEVEKANPKILDLFLQVLDEGFLTDGLGRRVSFTNSIIICTSNAGANLIRKAVQNAADYENTKKTLLDYLQTQNIYRSEFLNRFTQVVLFAPLSREEIAQVAELMIEKLKKTIYNNRKVKLEIASEAVTKLADQGYDPEMGARPMARTIQEKVENIIADKILSGELKEGDSYLINAADV
jgi:ATP-dependent Clp protease ATP-binding subunit ClpA